MIDVPWHEAMYNLDCMVNRAILRLRQIADSERVMGFTESADTYDLTASEVGAARQWVLKELRNIIAGEEG